MRTLFLKSTAENYEKEKDGRKPNTVRFTDDWTKERWDDYYTSNLVCISHTGKAESFVRHISDKTQYKNLVIISWLHPSDSGQKTQSEEKKETITEHDANCNMCQALGYGKKS